MAEPQNIWPAHQPGRPAHQHHQVHEPLFSLKWKNVSFTQDDVIDVAITDSKSEIARINYFCVHNDSRCPSVNVSWYWTEEDLRRELLQLYHNELPFELPDAAPAEYSHKHLYLGVLRRSDISIDSIRHKLVMCDTLQQQNVDMFFGRYAFDLEFGDVPFKPIAEALSDHHEDNDATAASTTAAAAPANGEDDVPPLPSLEPLDASCILLDEDDDDDDDDDDDVVEIAAPLKEAPKPQAFSPQTTTTSSPTASRSFPKRQVSRKRKRKEAESTETTTTTSEVKNTTKKRKRRRHEIMAANQAELKEEELRDIQRICSNAAIDEGCTLGCNLYFFDCYYDVYTCIEALFEEHDTASFNQAVFKKSQSWCRDVKHCLHAKGPIVPLRKMQESISQRFGELKRKLASRAPMANNQNENIN